MVLSFESTRVLLFPLLSVHYRWDSAYFPFSSNLQDKHRFLCRPSRHVCSYPRCFYPCGTSISACLSSMFLSRLRQTLTRTVHGVSSFLPLSSAALTPSETFYLSFLFFPSPHSPFFHICLALFLHLSVCLLSSSFLSLNLAFSRLVSHHLSFFLLPFVSHHPHSSFLSLFFFLSLSLSDVS